MRLGRTAGSSPSLLPLHQIILHSIYQILHCFHRILHRIHQILFWIHISLHPTRIGTYGAELGCFSQHLKLIDGLLKSAPRESLLATQSLHLENQEDEKIYKQTLIFGTGSYISTVYCIHELTCMAANTSATRIFSTRLLFHLFIFIKIILSIYICSSLLRDHFLSSTVLVVWIWHGL